VVVCIHGVLTYELVDPFQIQKRYKAATGYLPIVFEGSSPGAGKFGYLKNPRRHLTELKEELGRRIGCAIKHLSRGTLIANTTRSY
jgi:hypothetical protein